MDAPSYRTHHMRHLVAQAGGPAGWIRKHAGTRWQQAQVSQWISESNPKGIGHKLARDLEVAMGLPHGYLDLPGDGGESMPMAGNTADHGAAEVIAEPETDPGYVRVEQIDAEAGMGGEVVNDDYPDVIRAMDFTHEYIRGIVGFVPPPGRLILMTGRGDSMVPTIHPGDTVVVDTGVTSFDGDGLYLINMGNGHQIKRLVDRGLVHVASDNRAAYGEPFQIPEGTVVGGKVYLRTRIERFN